MKFEVRFEQPGPANRDMAVISCTRSHTLFFQYWMRDKIKSHLKWDKCWRIFNTVVNLIKLSRYSNVTYIFTGQITTKVTICSLRLFFAEQSGRALCETKWNVLFKSQDDKKLNITNIYDIILCICNSLHNHVLYG